MCSRILPEVKHAVLTRAQATRAAPVVLAGSGATGRRSGFENKFLSNITCKFLHAPYKFPTCVVSSNMV